MDADSVGPGSGVSARTKSWAPAVYFLFGQAGWFGCVLSAARGAAWIGVTIALVLVAMHLFRVERPSQELKLVAAVVVMGGIWESTLVRLDLLAYPQGAVVQGFAPLWILALWGLFAAQFNTTYQWLKNRIKTAALLGAVAGPVSFHAGAALAALRFARPLAATITLAVGWGCLLPVVVLLARRWDGVSRSGPGGRGGRHATPAGYP